MRSYTLAAIIAFCLLLIGLWECLSRLDAKNGGLFLTNEIGKFSPIQSFAYLYLPTIISLLFGMVYAWIDLDVRRLEPFFRLSASNGALAEDSLLLQWPVEFLALVPFKAFKRRYGTRADKQRRA